MSALRYYPIILGGATALAVGIGLILRGRRKTAEQLERERRMRLSLHGRITDGTVIDAQEVPRTGESEDAVQLLIYQYDVSGVSYEASQDITHLRQFVDIHTCKVGVPSSVKYNPQNPGDSIVIAEDWSGLRLAPLPSGIARRHLETERKR
ncbi:MAG TPA: DUF3592 domain-containing protein [Terriglobales bacterium]|nr:DUF3592 domain-containing protein [Terriglobales bacterium]